MDRFKIITKAVYRWNPCGLFPHAPEGEFDYECKVLTEKIDEESSIEEIAKVISDLFSEMFESAAFTVEECIDVASEIKLGLLNQIK